MSDLKRNAEIIERFIGMEETALSISNSTGISIGSIEAIIKMYNEPPTHSMVMQSRVNYGYRDWYIYDNWQRLSIAQLAEILMTSPGTIKKRAVFLKLSKKSRIVINAVKHHYKARLIIFNTQTGIYYFSQNEAADVAGINHQTFKNMMVGYRKNRTDFVRVL